MPELNLNFRYNAAGLPSRSPDARLKAAANNCAQRQVAGRPAPRLGGSSACLGIKRSCRVKQAEAAPRLQRLPVRRQHQIPITQAIRSLAAGALDAQRPELAGRSLNHRLRELGARVEKWLRRRRRRWARYGRPSQADCRVGAPRATWPGGARSSAASFRSRTASPSSRRRQDDGRARPIKPRARPKVAGRRRRQRQQ